MPKVPPAKKGTKTTKDDRETTTEAVEKLALAVEAEAELAAALKKYGLVDPRKKPPCN